MDLRDFFASTNLPQPSSFPTRKELNAQAAKLSKQILSNWNTLRVIVERREASLRKRWLKRTLEQRKKILQMASSSIPVNHRPDFEAFRKETPAERAAGSKYRDAYLRPHINLEDLVEGKTFLLLINSRARNLPDTFARADFNAMHLGIVSGAIQPAFLNEHVMILSDATSASNYGKVISWDDDYRAFGWMNEGVEFMPGEGLLVLEVQNGLYDFLLKSCQNLFADIGSEELKSEMSPVLPEPEAMVNKDGSYASIAAVAFEAPYRAPPTVDFARLRDIVAAQRDAAVDHFWALREDPAYFSGTLRDWADHRQETMLDTQGRQHPLLNAVEFWQRVVSNAVHNAYEVVLQWVIIHNKLQDVAQCQQRYQGITKSSSGLPEDFERALRRLRDVVETLSKVPIEALKIGVPPSPPMRSKWVREPQQAGSHIIGVRSKPGTQTDPLIFIFNMLWDEHQRFLFTLPRLMDELEYLAQRDSKQRQNLSGWVRDKVSEVAIMGEILHQIELYPGTAKFETISDDGDAEASTKASIAMITSFHDPGSRRPNLGPLVIPLSKFTYPVEKRRTAQNIEILRTAEKNLDDFWLKVDRELLDKNGLPHRERLIHILPAGELQRTPKWVEPENLIKTQTHEPLEELSDNFSGLRQTEERPDWTRPDSKIKTKTKGTADPSKVEVASADPPARLQPDIQPTLKLGKRAFKVFATLFHTPTTADQVGEIPWNDFLHAMASTGFSVEKLYGSVWQFTPTYLDVDTSISFHEPHPHGKIPFRTARRIGRRLQRTYGWEGSMFRQE